MPTRSTRLHKHELLCVRHVSCEASNLPMLSLSGLATSMVEQWPIVV